MECKMCGDRGYVCVSDGGNCVAYEDCSVCETPRLPIRERLAREASKLGIEDLSDLPF
jgi:hypothetical protein